MRHSGGRCDFCHALMIADAEGHGYCGSCALYNAAVIASQAAAAEIARAFDASAEGAWLNEYGVFADIGGIKRQIGTPEQAAPFCALIHEARKVKTFWREPAQE